MDFRTGRAFTTALFTALLFLACTAWAADPTLRISTSYREPFTTPKQTGMLDQIILEACHRIGVKAEFVSITTERSLVAVNDGMVDGEMNRIRGLEENYPNLVRVPEPNMRMDFVAFAKKDIPINGWQSIRNLRVGLVSGWKILERNTEGFPFVTRLTEVDNLFRMLELDRLDVVLYSKIGGYEEIHRLGYDNLHHLSPPLSSRDMFLYLHRRHAQLAAPLAKALKDMKKDGTYARIVENTTCHPHEDRPPVLAGP